MSGTIRVRLSDGPLWSVGSSYYSPMLVKHARAVPGMTFNGATRAWQGYLDATRALVARLQHAGLTVEGAEDLPGHDAWKTARTPFLFSTDGLRSYQVDGVRFILAHAKEGALLADEMRLGKMQPITEPVLTPTGWRPIGDLRPGDSVIGQDGKSTQVMRVFPQGEKPVFKVTFTDGAWTLCGDEHLWAVRTAQDKFRARPYRVLTLGEIRELGLFLGNSTNRRWFVPIARPPIFESGTALPLDPYVLGALLANGSFGRSQVSHTGGEDQRRQMRPLLPIGLHFRRKVRHTRGLQPIGPIRDILKSLGLHEKRSWEKHIPIAYLLAPPNARLSLLQGLMDNDGTVSRDGLTLEYNTTSPQLAKDVLALIRSLGASAWMSTRIPSYTYKGRKLKGRMDHRIRMSLPGELYPFRLPRKRKLYRPRTKFLPHHAIDRIEPAGLAECVCISVAVSDGLYITRDFLVTHNTMQAIIAARAFKVHTLVIAPAHIVGVWARPKDALEGPGEIYKWWPDAWKGAEGKPGVVRLKSVKPFAVWKEMERLHARKERTSKQVMQLKELTQTFDTFVESLQHANVVVCHYEILHAWAEVLKAWGVGFLILDEAHILSSFRARRSNVLKDLAKSIPRRLALSGTPLAHTPAKLHNLLDILAENRFGYFFTEKREGTYARLFCGSHQETVGTGIDQKTFWVHNQATNIDAPDGKYALTGEETLHERLQYLMLRRLKKEVDPELPPFTRQVIDVEIPAKKVIGISQAMLAPGGKELRRCLDLAADGKLKYVIDLLVNHLEEGQRILCFCYRRLFAERVAKDVKRALGKKGIAGTLVEFVHGGLSQGDSGERAKRLARLRAHTGPSLLACTVDTTSTGIDLSYATIAVVAELSHEWVDMAQCLDAKTEILTPYGFVPMGTIRKGDLVAAFDIKTEEIAYRPATSVIERSLGASERMFMAKGDRLNIKVTAGHRMVNKRHITGPNTNRWTDWEVHTAEEISKRANRYKIPVAGYLATRGVSLTDDELRVLGWFLTDGTLGNGTISFSQSSGSKHLKDLKQALDGANLAYGVSVQPASKAGKPGRTGVVSSQFNRNHDGHVYTVPRFAKRGDRKRTGWYKLAPYLDKNLSPLLFDISRRQLSVLLKAINWGDGVKRTGREADRTYHIGTANKIFADRLQHLCITRGFRANIVTTRRSGILRKTHGYLRTLKDGRITALISNRERIDTFDTKTAARAALYKEINRRRKQAGEVQLQVGKKPYYTVNVGPYNWRTIEGTRDGHTNLKPLPRRSGLKRGESFRVWCVSNDWGTLVIRRRGYTSIVGNCEQRLYKYGQTTKALVQYVIARGTGDELILRAVTTKLGVSEKAVGKTSDAMREDLSRTETLESAMRRLAKSMEAMMKERK
jgi:hypothetical protein